jgi:electron transfer flavoprotein beta subunit
MELKIAVCIKSVPDPAYYDKITIDAKTKCLTRKGVPSIIGKGDKVALEQALKLKEKYGGKVTVIGMAPPEARFEMKETLAMGADEALLLSDRLFAGADTLATAYTLAQGLKKMGSFDLVLTGTESADGATAQVPAQLGECLSMAHLWNVKQFSLLSDNEIQATVGLEHAVAEYIVCLPAVLGIARDAGKPRYITASGIKAANCKTCKVMGNAELQAEENRLGETGSPTWPGDITIPSMKRQGRVLEGSPDVIVEALTAALRVAGINIQRKAV